MRPRPSRVKTLNGRPLRIGCGAGYSNDRIEPAIELVERGDLDYIVFECLAERTIALAQQAKARDPRAGFDPLLRERMEAVLAGCHGRGVVLTAVNHAVVAAECAPSDDVSRQAVEFRDDIAAAPTTVGTTAARHIRMLVALRQISRQRRVLPGRPHGWCGLTGIVSISPDDDAIAEVRAQRGSRGFGARAASEERVCVRTVSDDRRNRGQTP